MPPTASPEAPFGRVLTAMVTPFTADGSLDLDAAQRLATHLVDSGNDGLVISGTTGESPTTSDAEKERLLRAVLEAVGGRAHVVAGIGTNDTRHTVELSQQAEKAGAHALLAVTPYYNKPPQEGIRRHFTAVADATGLPVMLYDIPGRAGAPIATESLVALAEHPRIVAVKDAKGDLYETSWVLARTDLRYYSGDDLLNLAQLAVGAAGYVSVIGHVASGRLREMADAFFAGDVTGAREINTALLPVCRGIMTRTQGAIAAKAALAMQGICGPTVRMPLVEATSELLDTIRGDLTDGGVSLSA